MKRVAVRQVFMFNPLEIGWTSLSDFDRWLGRKFAEDGMAGEKLEVLGSQESIIVLTKKSQTPQVTQNFKPKNSNLEKQFSNLTKGLK